MTDQHPITPPPELVQQWIDANRTRLRGIALEAAQWGADQELEACCALLQQKGVPAWSLLRLHRRPKPPSLKEQALADLDEIGSHYIGPGTADRIKTIRRALEALPE